MPICTYLTESDKSRPISNAAVNEWLANARESSGVQIVVHEARIETRRWFRTKTIFRYEVPWPIMGIEYQVVNFYRDGTDWSINTMVPAEMVVAYLIGVCTTRTNPPAGA